MKVAIREELNKIMKSFGVKGMSAEKFIEIADWKRISSYEFLSEEFMYEFASRLDFQVISHSQKLSEDFVYTYKYYFNNEAWLNVCQCQDISKYESLPKFLYPLTNIPEADLWYNISMNQLISDEFIIEHKDKICVGVLLHYRDKFSTELTRVIVELKGEAARKGIKQERIILRNKIRTFCSIVCTTVIIGALCIYGYGFAKKAISNYKINTEIVNAIGFTNGVTSAEQFIKDYRIKTKLRSILGGAVNNTDDWYYNEEWNFGASAYGWGTGYVVYIEEGADKLDFRIRSKEWENSWSDYVKKYKKEK